MNGNEKIEKSLQDSLDIVSGIVFYGAGLISLVLNLLILLADFGGGVVIISLILGPITDVIVPWYALFVHGIWLPLAIGYGGSLFSITIRLIGKRAKDQ